MLTIVKFVVKDLNPERLREELETAGILPEGALFAGFDRISDRLMEPFSETRVIGRTTGQPDRTADPGEIHLHYVGDPGSALDVVFSAHNATVLSTAQTNHDADAAAIPILVNRYQNWGALSDSQKDNVLKQLTRLVARLLDTAQDL